MNKKGIEELKERIDSLAGRLEDIIRFCWPVPLEDEESIEKITAINTAFSRMNGDERTKTMIKLFDLWRQQENGCLVENEIFGSIYSGLPYRGFVFYICESYFQIWHEVPEWMKEGNVKNIFMPQNRIVGPNNSLQPKIIHCGKKLVLSVFIKSGRYLKMPTRSDSVKMLKLYLDALLEHIKKVAKISQIKTGVGTFYYEILDEKKS